MYIRPTRTALAVALSLAFAPVFANADAANTIVITGTRFTEGLSGAIGVNVIDAEDIARSTATTLAEVLDRLGGVNVRRNLFGSDDAELDLRGFGASGSQNTLVVVDGQILSENELLGARISGIPLAAIERIEILRGAGAVIYGGGATSGVINIVTRAPRAIGAQGYVFAQTGSLDMRELRGGAQFVQDRLGLRLDASERSTDNWRNNNDNRTRALSGEARLAFDDGFVAVRFAGDEQRSRLPGSRTQAQLRSDPRGTGTPNDFANSDVQRLTLSAEKSFGEVRFGVDLSQRNKDAEYHYDYGFGTYADNSTRGEEESFSPRVEWSTRFGGIRNKLVVGGDWRDLHHRGNGLSDFGFGATPTAERAEQRNTAYYLQNQTVFLTGTELALGSRREHIRQSWRETVTPLAQRRTEHALDAWEAALRQNLGRGFSGHLRRGESYRVANVDENRCYFAPCSPMLAPQTAFETGIGIEWRAGPDRVRVEHFDMEVHNELHYNVLAFANINMPPMQRKGWQFDWAWQALPILDLNGSYTRTEARFTRGNFAGIDIGGNDVPLVPRDRATVQAGWQFLPATRVTLAHTYVGEQRYDNDQANRFRRMPHYGLTDIKVSHRWQSLTLSAGVNNLFDKDYYSYGITNGTYTSFNAYPEMPRTAYLNAEYRF